jgi:predicted nucleic acid-binding protein
VTTFLLDTCIIIDVINNRRSRDKVLEHLLNEGHVLACCAVNFTEIYAGLRAKEASATQTFLASLQFLPITPEAAQLAGLLCRDFSRKGITLALGDVMIAGAAIHHGATLITDNVKDFPMKELKLYPLPPR